MLSSEQFENLKAALIDTIDETVKQAFPKEWLTREDVEKEFGVTTTTIWKLENDAKDPLPYTSFGDRKHLYHRSDLNHYLQRRKRSKEYNVLDYLMGDIVIPHQKFANGLQVCNVKFPFSKNFKQVIKYHNIVVLYGSGKKAYFIGAFEAEVPATDGQVLRINNTGIETNPAKGAKSITVRGAGQKPTNGNYFWSFETDLIHSQFEMAREETKGYCRGIVFSLDDF